MPIKPVQEFGSAYSNAATPEYPNGSYKDETVPLVSRDGSPLVAVTENDRLGFDEALSAEVGMTFTNTPDTALSSQRLEAHKKLIEQNTVTFNTIEEMVSHDGFSVGDAATVGGSSFRVLTTASTMTIADFEPIGYVYAQDLGIYEEGHPQELSNCAPLINYYLPYVRYIVFKEAAEYLVTETVYIAEDQGLITLDENNLAFIRYTPSTVMSQGIIESVDYFTVSQRRVLITVGVKGNLSQQPVGVPDVEGGYGCGMKLTVGESRIKTTVFLTPGVGIILDGNSIDLYTHINQLHLTTIQTGHEGIILARGSDQRAEYLEAYFPWDSLRDSDYTQDKISKYKPDTNLCTGVMFYYGACEVIEMHPNNNRHGWAWAVTGNAQYRLRVSHGIGEGSAGGAYIGPTSRVTGGYINVHSTRGKYGLPLFKSEGANNLNIGMIDIQVDVNDGYPLEDGGTYAAMDISGDVPVLLPNVKIWTRNGKCSYGLRVSGDGHKIGGIIDINQKDDFGNNSVAVRPYGTLVNADIDFNILSAGLGLQGESGTNSDHGKFNLNFHNCLGDVAPTYLGTLDEKFIRRGEWYNFDTGKTNQPVTVVSSNIPASNADGSFKSVDFNFEDLLFQEPVIVGSELLNVTDTNVVSPPVSIYHESQIGKDVTVNYAVGGSTQPFKISLNVS